MSGRQDLPVRRMIGTLLRLARAGLDDARRLLDDGSLRNAASLLAEAAQRLAQAMAVAERGLDDALPTGERLRAHAENPHGEALRRLLARLPDETRILPDGRLSAPPDRAALDAALPQAAALLDALAAHFDLPDAADAPVARRDPPRADPEPGPAPTRIVRPPVHRATSSQAAAPPALSRPDLHAAPVATHITSSDFWALADDWDLDDLQALDLLGHESGLTKKGTRPRFRLSGPERERFLQLRDLADALAAQGERPKAWLRKRIAGRPFGGRTPLEMILKDPDTGLPQLGRHVLQQGLRGSLRGSGGSARS